MTPPYDAGSGTQDVSQQEQTTFCRLGLNHLLATSPPAQPSLQSQYGKCPQTSQSESVFQGTSQMSMPLALDALLSCSEGPHSTIVHNATQLPIPPPPSDLPVPTGGAQVLTAMDRGPMDWCQVPNYISSQVGFEAQHLAPQFGQVPQDFGMTTQWEGSVEPTWMACHGFRNAGLSFSPIGVDINRLPTPPPPDHPPSFPSAHECHGEAVPPNCLDGHAPEVSNQRKSGALRWADLDPESEGSGDESQHGVRLATPSSAASTGAPTSCATESPARSQVNLNSPARVSNGEVEGEEERVQSVQGTSKAHGPTRRGPRSKVSGWRRKLDESEGGFIQGASQDGIAAGQELLQMLKGGPNRKSRTAPRRTYDSAADGYSSTPVSFSHQVVATDEILDIFHAEDTDESPPSDPKNDQPSVDQIEDSIDEREDAEALSDQGDSSTECIHSARLGEGGTLGSVQKRQGACSLSVDDDGTGKKSRNRGTRVHRKKRQSATHARKKGKTEGDADGSCSYYGERIRKAFCSMGTEIRNSLSGVQHTVRKVTHCSGSHLNSILNCTTERIHSFSCRMGSSPRLSLLVVAIVAIYLGQWHSSRIRAASDEFFEPQQAPHWYFRNFPRDHQYYDRTFQRGNQDYDRCQACAPP